MGSRTDSLTGPPTPPTSRAALAYVHPGDVRASFFYSVVRASAHETATHGVPFALIGEQCPSGDLPAARNRLVAHFLDNTTIPWLWCVDADMGFSASTLSDLIEAADPTARPVVGALCFGLRRKDFDDELQATTFETFPTLYDFMELDDDAGFAARSDYPADELVPVGATGAACLIVHRTLLETIRAKYGDHWFSPASHPCGRTYSEDLSFCVRVAGVDRPLFVHTGIRTSHDKGGVMLTEAEYRRQDVRPHQAA